MDREDAGSNGGIDVHRSHHAYIHVSLFFSHLPLFFEAVEAKFIVPFVSRKKQHAFIDPTGNIYGRLITLGPFVPRRARPRLGKLERRAAVCFPSAANIAVDSLLTSVTQRAVKIEGFVAFRRPRAARSAVYC